MIGYVKGVVTHIFIDSCFVDVHGVGYRVYVPGSTMEKLTVGREMLLFTYMSVREDAILLYGFQSQDEYDLFMLLVGVNKVGPKVALGIMSAIRPDSFRMAVRQKNIAVLTKLPGIGKKTAERLILELQDKIGRLDREDNISSMPMDSAVPQGIAQETLAALTSLGYSSQEVLPAIEGNVQQCTTVEELLKKVLRVLGSGR
ncbi:MAG: Holliday junction branch migration protein RuvA [Megasphaera sp.]|jgi:Holliday junction DNA helicase RuvA|uniref:Holliday junction branch migration protein RuvA n=1 Tax=Megasphaera sueciensis TaxID=349094 RepID=UPI003D08DD09|nr:Holliday junction branch migration protein RuvA [Megasphaera sp.]MCI1823936.1 Holliday junction branch migration protein RuvA [Megasphaera sp.]